MNFTIALKLSFKYFKKIKRIEIEHIIVLFTNFRDYPLLIIYKFLIIGNKQSN